MRRLAALVLGGSLLLALPACSSKTDEAARAAGLTPASALAFFSVNLEPATEQQRNLLGIVRKFPDARDEVQGSFEDARDRLLSQLVSDSGLDYRRDVKPWLGNEMAVSVLAPEGDGDPTVALMIESKDEDEARDALEKSRASGGLDGEYRFVESFAVISDQEDPADDDRVLDRIQRQAGQDDGGLAESQIFTNVVDELHGDRLLLGWVNAKEGSRVAERLGAFPPGFALPDRFQGSGAVGFDLHTEESAMVVEGVADATGPPGGGNPVLTKGLPADSLGAITFFDVGGAIRDGLQFAAGAGGGDPQAMFRDATGLDLQADVLSWMGGESVLTAARPQPGQQFPDLALVVQPTDRAKAEAAMVKIRAVLSQRAGLALVERPVAGSTAYVVPEPVAAGIQPAMALFTDRFVLANRPEYLDALAKAASPGFAESDVYKSVVGTGSADATAFQMVIDIDPIREAIVAGLPASERSAYDQDVRANVEPLSVFGLVARRDGDVDRFEMKLSFD